MKLKCNKCGKVKQFEQKPKYNWKCPHCHKMNQIGGTVGVIWKTDTGTAKRNG